MSDWLKNKNTKTDSHAWRKNPRKFAPKSRLGCRTCKIRRVKCDFSQPSCLKCCSTGRTCDGYREMPLASKAANTEDKPTHHHKEITHRADRYDSYLTCTTISAYESESWHSKHSDLNSPNLGSFMILPVTEPTQAEAMCFFKDVSIKHLNGYRPCESWRKTLTLFAQTVPSVQHAATALAMIHQNYLNHQSNDPEYQPSFSKDQLLDKAALLYYNRAIQLLLDLASSDSAETIAITLVVCYLFTCFDHLMGDDRQAVKHLRGGVALSCNIDNTTLYSHPSAYHNSQPSGVHAIINQVTKQIRRLDLQASIFIVDWTPANIQETFASHLIPSNSTFYSLDQAADHLQILVVQVMRLRNTEQQMSPVGTMPPLPSSLKEIVLEQLETWSGLFETLLRRGSSSFYESKSDSFSLSETNRLIPLLRLQHTIAWTLLSGYGPEKENDYDKFLSQFQQCVALAREVAAAHDRYTGSSRYSTSTFTPEIGIIPILYIIGAKCRHSLIRRQALSILRRHRIREAAWDSIVTARVVERVIEVEEGTIAAEEQMLPIQCMEQIPVWRRIEVLSYCTHGCSGQSAGRVDIRYTFCGREGIHTESLMIE
ncbi:hypothetical protein BJX70DRAFT_389864 [Aspergillus crustosus]